MRLTLPTRVPIKWVGGYTAIMFVALIVEGTKTPFTMLFVVHTVLLAYAFNIAGGFSRISGAYVFFYGVLTVTFGVTWKVILNQPADTNLSVPLLDMSLYTVSMALLALVVLMNRAIDLRSYSLAMLLRVENINYSKVGLGCLVSAFLIQFLDVVIGAAPGSLLSAINQLNVFLPLSIIMSTVGAIKTSNGRSALDGASGLGLILNLILGMLAFSKQGMLEPMACWIIGVAYMRFELRRVHYISILLAIYFILFLASPISGLRNEIQPNAPYSDRITILINGITHWGEVKKREAENEAFSREKSEGITYFGSSQGGLVERGTMLPADDPLFAFSATGHYVGYETILWDFENWIPHFIMPDKHAGFTGNYYVHEMGGGLAADDFTTGISFSPLGEAYHIDGWTSVFVLLPSIWALLFFSFDVVVGDIKRSPWGLLVVILMIHTAPESLLSNLIQIIGYGNLSVAFAMFFSTKLAPVIGSLLYADLAEAPAQKVILRARPT